MHDRLLLARDLLLPSGSIFVQINDENLHHVRELLDEIFGAEDFCARINITKTVGQTDALIATIADPLLWYSRDKSSAKYRQIFKEKAVGFEEVGQYYYADFPQSLGRLNR